MTDPGRTPDTTGLCEHRWRSARYESDHVCGEQEGHRSGHVCGGCGEVAPLPQSAGGEAEQPMGPHMSWSFAKQRLQEGISAPTAAGDRGEVIMDPKPVLSDDDLIEHLCEAFGTEICRTGGAADFAVRGLQVRFRALRDVNAGLSSQVENLEGWLTELRSHTSHSCRDARECDCGLTDLIREIDVAIRGSHQPRPSEGTGE